MSRGCTTSVPATASSSSHIRKYLRAMTTLLENGLPAAEVMKAVQGPVVGTVAGTITGWVSNLVSAINNRLKEIKYEK